MVISLLLFPIYLFVLSNHKQNHKLPPPFNLKKILASYRPHPIIEIVWRIKSVSRLFQAKNWLSKLLITCSWCLFVHNGNYFEMEKFWLWNGLIFFALLRLRFVYMYPILMTLAKIVFISSKDSPIFGLIENENGQSFHGGKAWSLKLLCPLPTFEPWNTMILAKRYLLPGPILGILLQRLK